MKSLQMAKPHIVCIPFPAQGHINPMFKLAKIFHAKGFHITFIHSEYNCQRLLKSRGPYSLDGLPAFRYETFADGLPSSNIGGTQDISSLLASTEEIGPVAIRNIILKLNDTASSGVPPVSCIISDGVMSFTLDIAKEMGVPELLFWTPSACGFMGYIHYKELIEKDIVPLRDETYLVNGYLETPLVWLSGMSSNIRLKDMPSFVRTTNVKDVMLNFAIRETSRVSRATSIILNTFYDLEHHVLEAMASILPPIYDIGPLDLLYNHMIPDKSNDVESMGSNLWKEDSKCLEWLDTKPPGSIIYVNFGSISVLTRQQMIEFAWGLCNSNKDFLWIIRPDLVRGDNALLPEEFMEETKERGMLTSWCSQKDVLHHPAIGGFLTHCGWNSTLESIYCGVPMLCWPFFGEQQTNCRYSCMEWSFGLEIDKDVKREEVTDLIIKLMEGEKGKQMRRKIQEWKVRAISATQKGGTSFIKMEKLLNHVHSIL